MSFEKRFFQNFKKNQKSPLTNRKVSVIIQFVGVKYFCDTEADMEENFALLLDIYGELLSKTQREAVDLKYNSDLSLSEIAEEMGGISRPAANDARKKGEKRLLEFEEILGNAKRLKFVTEKISQAREILTKLNEDFDGNISRLSKILSEIENAM